MSEILPREIGEGNFSIGSGPKDGLLSVKIDLNDMVKSEAIVVAALEFKARMNAKIDLMKVQGRLS